MKVLFAAPEDAWGGIFYRYQQALPEFEWQALGHYQLHDLHGVDVLIPTMSKVTEPVLASANQLKLIQQVGAGLEGVDLAAAEMRKIAVANVPTGDSGNADSVAELTVWMMLSLVRQARLIPQALQQRQLGTPCGDTLQGRTVGLIGFGGLGQAIAKRLRAFDMTLLAVKRHADTALAERFGLEWCADMSQLDTLLSCSDHVILTLPDSPDSHHLLNSHRLALMKPSAFVINVGRGGVVDTDALVDALNQQRLAGAGLDVFEQEPADPDHPLFAQNVIASAHIGGVTHLSQQGIFDAVVENLQRLKQNDPLAYRVV
ncbi:2-hydroxyacid dehydrogenase [Celerinatantimonas yamalensis]|uniref:2-hydroxyacid dehydrogenase n=1 Tax=Celerinatantimonas yamalensis TaxID=559956 RepID=A0ABW9G9Z6_9GAMM